MSAPSSVVAPIDYPESDGLPMADNSVQFWLIQLLTANLDIAFGDRMLVGGNLFWYAVQGFPNIVQAPDAFVVLDRPPGHRSSYKQWEENDRPMTVVFEVRSPNDSDDLMEGKFQFYDRYEAEEYYVLDPQEKTLNAYRRLAGDLAPQRLTSNKYTSPLLGIQFQVSDDGTAVFYPDGRPFLSAREIEERAVSAEKRTARLAELTRRVLSGQITSQEMAELQQLLAPAP